MQWYNMEPNHASETSIFFQMANHRSELQKTCQIKQKYLNLQLHKTDKAYISSTLGGKGTGGTKD